MPPQEPVSITSLDLNQLASVKERIESEMQRFQSSGVALQRVAADFEASGKSIEQLGQAEEGQKMMLPLTTSLYVNGTLASNEKVLVDIGTGYFVEMTTDEGVDYCKRKVNKMKESIDQINQLLREKSSHLQQVVNVFNDKYQAQQGQRSS